MLLFTIFCYHSYHYALLIRLGGVTFDTVSQAHRAVLRNQ